MTEFERYYRKTTERSASQIFSELDLISVIFLLSLSKPPQHVCSSSFLPLSNESRRRCDSQTVLNKEQKNVRNILSFQKDLRGNFMRTSSQREHRPSFHPFRMEPGDGFNCPENTRGRPHPFFLSSSPLMTHPSVID